MCGIFGVINLDGAPADPGVVAAMARVTRHRGPDDNGYHADGSALIGMTRLSVIDLAGGHQPLSNADGSVWLVCNGEIYNFRELRSELKAKGHVFRTASDSEVVLHAYAEYGDRCVDHLNGMFGFALWDARRLRMLIARDRLGIKPIYVANDGRRFAFASEAKALLTLPGMRREVDPLALCSYLQLGYVAAPCSMFAGIAKLPPATLLTVEAGRVAQRSYWKVPERVDPAISEATWIERVRTRMEESVRMQMVSDVPIGAFLSGGVDSSAVVCFMSKHSVHPVKTYSIGFSGTRADEYYNELPFARRVADLFHTDHHEILVKPDVVALLPKLLWHMDEPIADTAFITTYLVSEFARREVTVILSGVGGDELFGGYRRYLGSHYHKWFDRLPGWAKQGMCAAGRRLPSDRHSRLLNLFRYGKAFLATAQSPADQRYLSYLTIFGDDARNGLMRQLPPASVNPVIAAFGEVDTDDEMNRMLAVDARTQLPDDLLLLTDKMSMAVSLECRVPLLDHELVELAATIPESIKVRGGTLKYAMKKALEDVLPQDILQRKKRGFGTPMGAWLKTGLAPLLASMLSRQSVDARGLFNYPAVRELIAAHETNREDHTDQLLSLMNLEIWSRIYLDDRTPEDVTAEISEALA